MQREFFAEMKKGIQDQLDDLKRLKTSKFQSGSGDGFIGRIKGFLKFKK